MRDGVAGPMDEGFEFQGNGLEGLSDPFVFGGGKCSKQQIRIAGRRRSIR